MRDALSRRFTLISAIKKGFLSASFKTCSPHNCATLEIAATDDLEAALLRFAQSHAELRAQPESIARRRLLISESVHHPQEAKALLRAGIDVILEHLSDTIDSAMRNGTLRACDPNVASELFVGMLYGAEIERELIGYPARASVAGREQWAKHVVSSFMKIYSVSKL